MRGVFCLMGTQSRVGLGEISFASAMLQLASVGSYLGLFAGGQHIFS